MKNKKILLGLTLSFLIIVLTGCTAKAEKAQINIAIAASMFESTEAIKIVYQREYPEVEIVLHSGSSGSLRRQIEQGADMDIFISASMVHMEKLQEEGYLLDDQYQALIANALVLIAPYDSNKVESIQDLKANESIVFAMGEPDSVPAGAYAKEVLMYYSIDANMPQKTVLAKDVKEVLTWVALGEADAGMVYMTDAMIEEKVKIIDVADSNSHQPIIYPIARLASSKEKKEVDQFKEFIMSERALEIFKSYGFDEID